jgi:uncharacterized protein
MTDYNLPTHKEALALLAEYHVPPHIVSHSLAAAKLAIFLAQRLRDKGIAVDIDLVERACLLHDIMRVCDFAEADYLQFERGLAEKERATWRRLRARYEKTAHEDAAYDILKQKYPRLAVVIRKHKYASLLDDRSGPNTWEEKLVYYADKRVMHEKIVPLEERLREGHRRNVFLHGSEAQSKINTARVDPLIFRLEKEIFDKLCLDPLELTEQLIDSY